MTETGKVWILDTSCLVETKIIVSISDQWSTFKILEEKVRSGQIAMPRHVIREISEIDHPDLPGAWAPGVRPVQCHPLDPSWDCVQRVMAEAGDVVDPNKTKEDADPYVIALALHLQLDGLGAVVVTEDRVDHSHMAVTTACDRLSVPHCSTREFLTELGIKTRKPSGPESEE